MKEKKSFVAFFEWDAYIQKIPSVDTREMIYHAMFVYAQTGKLPDDMDVNLAFGMGVITSKIDELNEHAKYVSEKRRENGKLGASVTNVKRWGVSANADKSSANADKSSANADKSSANADKSSANADKSSANADKSSANADKRKENEKSPPIPPIKDKEKEINKEKDKSLKKFDFKRAVMSLGVNEETIRDWLEVRRNKKASNTETAYKRLRTQILTAEANGYTAQYCIEMAAANSWTGFEYQWLINRESNGNNRSGDTTADECRQAGIRAIANIRAGHGDDPF